MHGTGATIAQSTEVARQAIESINLDQDSELYCHAAMTDLAEFCSVHLAKSCKYSYWQFIDRAGTIPQLLCQYLLQL
jgi:hypothetical protein